MWVSELVAQLSKEALDKINNVTSNKEIMAQLTKQTIISQAYMRNIQVDMISNIREVINFMIAKPMSPIIRKNAFLEDSIKILNTVKSNSLKTVRNTVQLSIGCTNMRECITSKAAVRKLNTINAICQMNTKPLTNPIKKIAIAQSTAFKSMLSHLMCSSSISINASAIINHILSQLGKIDVINDAKLLKLSNINSDFMSELVSSKLKELSQLHIPKDKISNNTTR